MQIPRPLKARGGSKVDFDGPARKEESRRRRIPARSFVWATKVWCRAQLWRAVGGPANRGRSPIAEKHVFVSVESDAAKVRGAASPDVACCWGARSRVPWTGRPLPVAWIGKGSAQLTPHAQLGLQAGVAAGTLLLCGFRGRRVRPGMGRRTLGEAAGQAVTRRQRV